MAFNSGVPNQHTLPWHNPPALSEFSGIESKTESSGMQNVVGAYALPSFITGSGVARGREPDSIIENNLHQPLLSDAEKMRAHSTKTEPERRPPQPIKMKVASEKDCNAAAARFYSFKNQIVQIVENEVSDGVSGLLINIGKLMDDSRMGHLDNYYLRIMLDTAMREIKSMSRYCEKRFNPQQKVQAEALNKSLRSLLITGITELKGQILTFENKPIVAFERASIEQKRVIDDAREIFDECKTLKALYSDYAGNYGTEKYRQPFFKDQYEQEFIDNSYKAMLDLYLPIEIQVDTRDHLFLR